jgi:LPXTG-site transpeptidase (sortase) family protein
LKRGDRIKLQTRRESYFYEVHKLRIVSPDTVFNIEVPGRLLLSTCYPAGSDRYRLIIVAKEVKQK